MKKLLLVLSFLFASTTAYADYRMIIPQEPGGGTSVWASIVAKNLEKFIGEKVLLEHIPGVNDITGPNKFQSELRKDPKTIMVAHGGNGESFLTDKIEYSYDTWEPIALVNLNIVASHSTSIDPYKDKIKFGATAGRRPDVMAMVLLTCGPKANVDEYIACYKQHVIYVKGMTPNEARLGAFRGELNTVRETFASQKKFIDPLIAEGKFRLWFSHGVLDLETGGIKVDSNYKTAHFENLYGEKWGKAPSGDFYDAYLLVKNFRDVLQKSMWVDKNNPNADKIRQAVRDMLKDPDALAALIADSGDYEWFVGKDMDKAYRTIRNQIKEVPLKALVKFTVEGIGLEGSYKPDLVVK